MSLRPVVYDAESRATRLGELYRLRTRIVTEIVNLECEITAEAKTLAAAKEASDQALAVLPNSRIALCGTDSGYYRHRRTLLEAACEACKVAHSQYERDRIMRREQSKETL